MCLPEEGMANLRVAIQDSGLRSERLRRRARIVRMAVSAGPYNGLPRCAVGLQLGCCMHPLL